MKKLEVGKHWCKIYTMNDLDNRKISDTGCSDTLYEAEIVAREKASRKVLYICKMWSSDYKEG